MKFDLGSGCSNVKSLRPLLTHCIYLFHTWEPWHRQYDIVVRGLFPAKYVSVKDHGGREEESAADGDPATRNRVAVVPTFFFVR